MVYARKEGEIRKDFSGRVVTCGHIHPQEAAKNPEKPFVLRPDCYDSCPFELAVAPGAFSETSVIRLYKENIPKTFADFTAALRM